MAALKKTLIMIKPAFAVLEMNQQGEALAPWVKAGDLFQNFLDTQLPFLYIQAALMRLLIHSLINLDYDVHPRFRFLKLTKALGAMPTPHSQYGCGFPRRMKRLTPKQPEFFGWTARKLDMDRKDTPINQGFLENFTLNCMKGMGQSRISSWIFNADIKIAGTP